MNSGESIETISLPRAINVDPALKAPPEFGPWKCRLCGIQLLGNRLNYCFDDHAHTFLRHRARRLGKLGIRKTKKRPRTEMEKIKSNLISLINGSLSYSGINSGGPKFQSLVGCNVVQFKIHIQKQFKSGMNWSNKGRGGWHLDHKKPCALFDLTDPTEVKKCFHYTNFKPMWEKENLSKNDKWLGVSARRWRKRYFNSWLKIPVRKLSTFPIP